MEDRLEGRSMSFAISREETLIQLTNDDDSSILQNLNEKTTPIEQFNNFLIASIDESLILLGEPVKNELYRQLELNFNIKKNDIPQ